MRVYIHYKETHDPWGGSNSFLKAFLNFLRKNTTDIEIIEDINASYDILFLNSAIKAPGILIDIQNIKKIKKYGYTKVIKSLFHANSKKKIVIRLDGLRAIYNKQWNESDDLQIYLSQIADWIIFQSKFSLESFKEYGYKGDNYSIIFNGVDQNIFNIENKVFWTAKDTLKLFSCNWSDNPCKGYSTIALFSEIEGIECHFVGSWPAEIDKKNVICLPPMRQEELANYYKKFDIFLHAASNDPCPNVVFEALSSGLPIIYNNSGGTPEIAAKYGIPLPEELTQDKIQKTLEEMKNIYPDCIHNIQQDMMMFSIETAAEKYIQSFENQLREQI